MSIFRIDNYLEKWAEKYKPLSHNPAQGSKDKSFYRMDTFMKMEEFGNSLSHAKSPAMGVVTQMEGVGDLKKMVYTHRIFFLVRQLSPDISRGISNEMAAADAKAEGQELAQDLLSYLQNDKLKNGNPELKGLSLDRISVDSLPTKFNGWWPTEIIIEQVIAKDFCVNPEKYSMP